MPTVSEPKMVPPRRNAASLGSLLAPNEAARPPSAGGVGGAIGDSPSPGGRRGPTSSLCELASASGAAAAGSSARAQVAATNTSTPSDSALVWPTFMRAQLLRKIRVPRREPKAASARESGPSLAPVPQYQRSAHIEDAPVVSIELLVSGE